MRITRHHLLATAALVALLAACDDDEVRFGLPGGLRIRGAVTVTNTCRYPTGVDEENLVCYSWPDVVFPILVNTETNRCANDGCHLAPLDDTGVNLVPDDPEASYDALEAFKNGDRPYIQEDGQDTAYILCNVELGAPTIIGTLMPPGSGMSAEDLAILGNWVACGMKRTGGVGSGGGGMGGAGGAGGAGGTT